MEKTFLEKMKDRRRRLNAKFQYTEENIRKLLWVNNSIMECFEKANAEAGRIYKDLKQREQNKDPFIDDIEVEIKMMPYILSLANNKKNTCLQKSRDKINTFLEDNIENSVILSYSYTEKPEENIHLSKETSWNIDGLGDVDGKNVFDNVHICYGLHELYDHTLLSLYDITKIFMFCTDINTSVQNISQGVLHY